MTVRISRVTHLVFGVGAQVVLFIAAGVIFQGDISPRNHALASEGSSTHPKIDSSVSTQVKTGPITLNESTPLSEYKNRLPDLQATLASYPEDFAFVVTGENKTGIPEKLLIQYVHWLVKEHPHPGVSQMYYGELRAKKIGIVLKYIDGAHGSFTLLQVKERGYVHTISYNPDSLLNETPRRLRLTILHEYLHSRQVALKRASVEFFLYREGQAIKDRIRWFEIEFEAHFQTAHFAISCGPKWTAEISTADHLITGFTRELIAQLAQNPVLFPERSELEEDLNSDDTEVIMSAMFRAATAENTSPGYSQILQPSIFAGVRAMRIGLADSYVRQGLLSPAQRDQVIANDPALKNSPR